MCASQITVAFCLYFSFDNNGPLLLKIAQLKSTFKLRELMEHYCYSQFPKGKIYFRFNFLVEIIIFLLLLLNAEIQFFE